MSEIKTTAKSPPSGDGKVLAWLVHPSTPANWFERMAKVVRDHPMTYPFWMPWPDPICSECGTKNAHVWPSRGNCQTCLKARLEAL